MLSNKNLNLLPQSAPKGLTQAQYEWFLNSCVKNETSLVEVMISYELINNAKSDIPDQGNILRQWIIQEHAKQPKMFLNQYVPHTTSEDVGTLAVTEFSVAAKVKKF
tara:strand:+ start:5490 stop:5810 length:321 start_codon:yes stop_codon:yes gene_type:complete